MTLRLTTFLLLTAWLGNGCATKSEAEVAPSVEDGTVTVGVHKVAQHTFRRRIEISADVLPMKQVTVISKVPGEVKKMFVSEGDKVLKGALVAKLDQKDFLLAVRQAKAQKAAAEAGVAAAEIGLETVTAKHGRLAKLRDKQVISESAYEDIEGSQRSTKAQVTLAQTQVQLASVGLDMARANLSYTEIRAPFDGEVAKRLVDEGARLNAMPPTPVAVIVDASQVKVVGAVSERDLPYVSAGTPVTVSVDALAGESIEAKVESVEPIVDPTSRTAGIQVLLNNENGKLHSGMSARLLIDMGARESATVPDDVVIRSEIEKEIGIVFVIENNKAVRRKVRLGVREGDLREILEGLKLEDTVVRGGQEKLKDGQLVSIENKKEPKR